MYNALILPDVPIDKISNDKLWKLKILLRIKVFGWYLRKGVVLTKDNLAKRIGMEVRSMFFVIGMKQLNTSFSNVVSLDLYDHSSK
jgi:hypothetical protein